MSKRKQNIEVFIIPINGIDVKFTYSNNIISYHFNIGDKNYGNALNILPEGKKRSTLESAIKGGGVLMLNAVESINNLNK